METGCLYMVATPIGNLEDITLRALAVLKSVDVILCEDTRVTSGLLAHFGITTFTHSYHQHSDARTLNKITELLGEGKQLALVTDAGTPGISDPGNMLVAHITKTLPEAKIVPIPGASAVTTALSISGLPTDKFIFLGFPPHKNKRQKYFKELAQEERTVVFYESGHRILKCLQNLVEVLEPSRQIVVCRELTKKFETVYRGTVQQIIDMEIEERGEFVIVVGS